MATISVTALVYLTISIGILHYAQAKCSADTFWALYYLVAFLWIPVWQAAYDIPADRTAIDYAIAITGGLSVVAGLACYIYIRRDRLKALRRTGHGI